MRQKRSTPITMHRAGELRHRPTPAEAKLWSHLRGNQLRGVSFRRQRAIGRYVVDFCSPDQKLIIEVDGSPHRNRSQSDRPRTDFLTTQGYRVMRFWNSQLMEDPEGTVREILEAVAH